MTDQTVEEFDFSGSQGETHAAEAMKGGDFEREIMYLSLDGSPAGIAQGKNRTILRFVTDSARRADAPPNKFSLAWITVAGHFAPTKPKPPYYEGSNWPGKFGSGCRKDPVFAKKYSGNCLICDQGNKPSKRVWGLAVEREEVRDDNGAVLGLRDKMREVFDRDAEGNAIVIGEKDGKKQYKMKTVPAWIVCQQGWKNFWQPLSGQATYHGGNAQGALKGIGLGGGSGLLDSDWVITRIGTENNDTNYTPIRLSTITIPAENPWGVPSMPYDLSAVLEDGRTLAEVIYSGETEDGDTKIDMTMPDLRRLIADKVSDDYFGFWFVPGWLPKDFDPSKVKSDSGNSASKPGGFVMGGGAAPATPSTPTTEEPPSSALDALKARVGQSA